MIFRKGGHLSVKEQWVFDNQRLELVTQTNIWGLFSQQNSVLMLLQTENILLAQDAIHLRL